MLCGIRNGCILWFVYQVYGIIMTAKNNTLNPICIVASVCRQVRRRVWCHLSHFHKGMYPINWCKMVCMGDLTFAFIWITSKNVFLSISNLRLPCICNEDLLSFWYRSLKFLAFVFQRRPSVLATINRNMNISDVFRDRGRQRRSIWVLLYYQTCCTYLWIKYCEDVPQWKWN